MIGKDEGGIKYIIEHVHGGKVVDDVHRHFLKRFIAPEIDHEPEIIPASQVRYPTKIVNLEVDKDEDISDQEDEKETTAKEVSNDGISKNQGNANVKENNIDGEVLKETNMGVEVSSRTRGKLILNKSQLSAQQTHQLGV